MVCVEKYKRLFVEKMINKLQIQKCNYFWVVSQLPRTLLGPEAPLVDNHYSNYTAWLLLGQQYKRLYKEVKEGKVELGHYL